MARTRVDLLALLPARRRRRPRPLSGLTCRHGVGTAAPRDTRTVDRPPDRGFCDLSTLGMLRDRRQRAERVEFLGKRKRAEGPTRRLLIVHCESARRDN